MSDVMFPVEEEEAMLTATRELTCGDGAHGHEKHGKVPRAEVARAGGDGVPDGGDEREAYNVKRAVFGLCGGPSDAERDEERRSLLEKSV